jgi:hypothetical protein
MPMLRAMAKLTAHPLTRRIVAFACVALCLLAVAPLAEACPQCKKALASSQGGMGGNIVQAYFISICFMLATPFVVLGGLSTYFYSLVRRARRDAASVDPATLAGLAYTPEALARARDFAEREPAPVGV